MAKPKQTVESILELTELNDSGKLFAEIQQFAAEMPKEWGTDVERKILAAKAFGLEGRKTVTDICGNLEIDRSSWYKVHEREGFGAKCVKLASQIKGRYAPGVMHSFILGALRGNPVSQIAFLRDVGALEKAESGKSGDVTVNVAVVEAERKDKLKHGLERFGVNVVERKGEE